MDQPQVNDQIKSAIKAKLKELGTYVDDELPGWRDSFFIWLKIGGNSIRKSPNFTNRRIFDPLIL